MGIDVRIESEDGEVIEELLDFNDLVDSFLSQVDHKKSNCLRFIDPYGDTTFNQIQIPIFIEELALVLKNIKDPITAEHGQKLLQLAKRAVNKIHIYLKFYGD